MALLERSCSMTEPSVRWSPPGVVGSTRFTYRSPNSVFGSSRADTSFGIRSTLSGCSASSSSAPSPVLRIARTSPTISPRTFTSDEVISWLPTWSVFSVTVTTLVNALS